MLLIDSLNNNLYEIVGFLAAFLTTAAFLPQVYKTWKTKDVSSLSLPMLLIFLVGIILWLIYGIFLNSPSMVFANAVTVISATLLIYFKIRYSKK
ncbi:SemiSWEET transporter [Hyunsoonleella sp. SJ7]|uniref:SemiSWEET transporter n=1 Tax=Hyunsoonleella aquatilis TaxID=2762758 RepID=A0A923H8S1_9FLAO|nr:SemiSWEET transporter [Hyunsoonleella aquatilis]MBC3756942.1 SemiSWEET transporter [Hyunsoonleella aquatilis]